LSRKFFAISGLTVALQREDLPLAEPRTSSGSDFTLQAKSGVKIPWMPFAQT
jgi:hypothetical protein